MAINSWKQGKEMWSYRTTVGISSVVKLYIKA